MTARHSPAKRVARRAVRRARALPDPERALSRAVVATRLAAHAGQVAALPAGDAAPPRVVALHVSLPDEPGTAPLRAALRAAGHRVLLPVLREDLDLDWVDDDGTASAPAHARTPPGAPLGPDAVAGCDVVVVPALAVDRSGTRLGQGGGSYDRALTRLPAGVPVVAVVHDEELLAAGALPREDHDRPVTHALTPSGVVPLDLRTPAGPAAAATGPPR